MEKAIALVSTIDRLNRMSPWARWTSAHQSWKIQNKGDGGYSRKSNGVKSDVQTGGSGTLLPYKKIFISPSKPVLSSFLSSFALSLSLGYILQRYAFMIWIWASAFSFIDLSMWFAPDPFRLFENWFRLGWLYSLIR